MTERSSNWLHEGYMDGLKGLDPDPKLSEWPGSEYNEGWLIGDEDRKSGVPVPTFQGPYRDEELPIQPGMEVTISKGVIVKTIGRDPKPAGKTYKVKVNHLLCGCPAYWEGKWYNRRFVRPTGPLVRWAGPGGYWSETDINNIPEANAVLR